MDNSKACTDCDGNNEELLPSQGNAAATRRRSFIKQVGAAAAVFTAPWQAVAREASPEPVSSNSTQGGLSTLVPENLAEDQLAGCPNGRIKEAFELRVSMARQDARKGPAVNVNNGDPSRYADKSGTFTKTLPHDDYGRVDQNAFAAFATALKSGEFSDFEKIPMGGTRTLNGPQAGLAFELSMMDGVQFGQPQVPPAPAVGSDQTATELLEHYWGSLLRDEAFASYDTNAMAAQAAAELGAQSTYLGPRNSHGRVTPDLLFRGAFPGETLGPYVSQFLYLPAFLGPQPVSQQQLTYLPNIDYGTDFGSWLEIQNGVDTGLRNQIDPLLRYRRNGRDLAALTHTDILFQEYFVAFLVLAGINANSPGSFSAGGAPLNPGNPYLNSRTQNGFGTFGGPDISATIEEVAVKALNAVWYQKWFVHLRPRPEAIGGIVHLLKSGLGSKTDLRLSDVVLKSQGLQQSYDKYGTWLLSQAFPEGSPAHPSYPTGHGTVAGACITVLKFFYDGDFVIPNPVVSTEDGLSLVPYTGKHSAQLTVNGELNKLGHNVTFGHGIHAGIHWRSDSDTSLLLGEAVALSFLRDKASTYNEPFSANITRFDGTTVSISNTGAHD